MSVAYIEPTSRTQRPGRPKLLIQRSPRSHVTRTPLSRSNGQMSRSQGRSAHHRVGASGGCSGGRAGTHWPWETAATLPSARRRKALRHSRERRGVGHIVAAARLQLVIIITLPEVVVIGQMVIAKMAEIRRRKNDPWCPPFQRHSRTRIDRLPMTSY